MSQMTYKEFIKEIRSLLLLTTGYDESRIYLKSKEDYLPTSDDRMFVEFAKLGNHKEVCNLHIMDLYASYLAGTSIQDLVGGITQELKRIENANTLANINQLSSYEKIKESLFIRPLNYEKHQTELQNAIYRINGDIALVLYVLIEESENNIISFKVPKNILPKWDMEENTVFESALINTYFLFPPRIYEWTKLLFNPNYTGENFMNLATTFELNKDSMGNCLSTTKKCNGAIAIFLPGVAQRIRHLLNDNFYIVFTSIHEAMIHREKTVSIEELNSILQDTLKKCTPEEDFLSGSIYYYDGNAISKLN